jgi:hypothetical protein
MNLDENITEHFKWREMFRSEYASRNGINNTTEDEKILANIRRMAEADEVVRNHFGLPMTVLSCYRSLRVNIGVGGSRTSAHKSGNATDFRISGIPVFEVCSKIPELYPEFDQVIYEFGESGWVHFGLSDKPRGQLLTAVKVKGKTVYKVGIVLQQREVKE